jgi:hypothetical protein
VLFALATPCPNSYGLRSEKAALNQGLKKGEKNVNVPKEIQNEKQSQEQPTAADNKDEADALRIPPDPNVPSGILSVIIHQINNRKPACCVLMLTNS